MTAERPRTTDQVAEHYQTDKYQVRRWIRQGRLRAINIGTARRPTYRITATELARFEAENQAPTT